MVRIDENDLVVLVYTVLIDPVRVEDTEVTASLANSLFSSTSQTALVLEMVDTLTDGFTIGCT